MTSSSSTTPFDLLHLTRPCGVSMLDQFATLDRDRLSTGLVKPRDPLEGRRLRDAEFDREFTGAGFAPPDVR